VIGRFGVGDVWVRGRLRVRCQPFRGETGADRNKDSAGHPAHLPADHPLSYYQYGVPGRP
jgi:hypothetical protein